MATTEQANKEFDSALRSYRRAVNRLGAHSAFTARAARNTMERLLPLVDDKRRAKYEQRDA